MVVFDLKFMYFGFEVVYVENGYFDAYFRRSRLDLGVFELLLNISLTYN